MAPRIADLHIHSCYSHDSLLSPRRILRRARRAGLTCVGITDHGTLLGAREAELLAKAEGVEVITGVELATDAGDIIGLLVEEEIHATAWEDAISAIRDQAGISLLPHPYRSHPVVEEVARRVDLIEVWNGRCTPDENARALGLSLRLGKPGIPGSDAHTSREIGNVRFVLDAGSWSPGEVLSQKYSGIWAIRESRAISRLKAGEFSSLVRDAGRLLAGRLS